MANTTTVNNAMLTTLYPVSTLLWLNVLCYHELQLRDCVHGAETKTHVRMRMTIIWTVDM